MGIHKITKDILQNPDTCGELVSKLQAGDVLLHRPIDVRTVSNTLLNYVDDLTLHEAWPGTVLYSMYGNSTSYISDIKKKL